MISSYLKKIKNNVKGHVHKHIFEKFINQNEIDENTLNYIFSGYLDYCKHYDYFLSQNIFFEDFFRDEISLKSFENFNDVVAKKIIEKEKDNIISRCFSQKHRELLSFKSKNIIGELVKEGISLKEFKDSFSKKISKIKDSYCMENELNKYLSSIVNWDKSFIKNKMIKSKLVQNIDYEVLFENKDKLCLKIKTFKASFSVGSHLWCISRDSVMFNRYQSEINGFNSFIFYFNFAVDYIDTSSQVAFLYDLNNEVNEVYLSNDILTDQLKEEEALINSLLSMGKKCEFSVFFNNLINLIDLNKKEPNYLDENFIRIILRHYKYCLDENISLKDIDNSIIPSQLKNKESFSIIDLLKSKYNKNWIYELISGLYYSKLDNKDFMKIIYYTDYDFNSISLNKSFLDTLLQKKGFREALKFFKEYKRQFNKINQDEFNSFMDIILIKVGHLDFKDINPLIHSLLDMAEDKFFIVEYAKNDILVSNYKHPENMLSIFNELNIKIEKESLFKFIYRNEDDILNNFNCDINNFKHEGVKELFFRVFDISNKKDTVAFWAIVFNEISSFSSVILPYLKIKKLDLLSSFSNQNHFVFLGSTGKGRSFFSNKEILGKEDLKNINIFKENYNNADFNLGLQNYFSTNDSFYIDFVKEISYNMNEIQNGHTDNIKNLLELFELFNFSFDYKLFKKAIEESKFSTEGKKNMIKFLKNY